MNQTHSQLLYTFRSLSGTVTVTVTVSINEVLRRRTDAILMTTSYDLCMMHLSVSWLSVKCRTNCKPGTCKVSDGVQ